MVGSTRSQAECSSLGFDIYCRKFSSGELRRTGQRDRYREKKVQYELGENDLRTQCQKIINTYHNFVIIIKIIVIIR